MVAQISGSVAQPAPQYCGHLIYFWTFYKLVLLDSSVRCIIHLPIALRDGLVFFCWLSSVEMIDISKEIEAVIAFLAHLRNDIV